ncbi:SET domain-containing protein 5 [Colletotrichum graminicola M1.001]|uniref:SET domain-containing protein 5 n=1 Tax=Colletotrichum graminicola (strain M1.001 / M2 / FGSC 10212) TaxID=645133 RepID=E3QJB2_COLGM|nr:SET domain-containing protein 5 [Colletotrichum graminicola M1.001]EFQ30950.1 SET domain-containing protein 5 [Colletotrichum graminicola M1.001]
MRSSGVLAWTCLAVALACDGGENVLDTGLTVNDEAQFRERNCVPGPLAKEINKTYVEALGDGFSPADGSIPDGLGDSEEARIRLGTGLRSDDGLWEVRPSPGKGLGVFALQTIHAGTRILDESPLFTIDPGSLVSGQGFSFAAIAVAVDEAFAALNATARAEFLSCPEHRNLDDEADAAWSREALVFRTNAYTMPGGTVGIFPRVAKVNHSCRPNAGAATVGGGGSGDEGPARRIVYAARDIRTGEEVTVTYAPLAQTTDERRARLAQWGFTCDCAACETRDDDEQRVEMRRLMGVIEAELGRTDFGRDVQPDTEKLVRLVEEVGLSDYLVKAYKYAAYAASRSGKFGAARRWARKELAVHEIADAQSRYAKETRAFLESLPLL